MSPARRACRVLGVVALLTGAGASQVQAQVPGEGAGPPNVVVLMTDDQTVRDMEPMAQTRRLIGRAGTTFTRSYVSYPVCCPSRATFLTGQYAHNHGVLCLYSWCGGGYGRLGQREYLPVWLERAGYVTAHIGKFLNGYGLEPRTPDIPRGWTQWFGLVDHFTYRMWGYKMHENGRTRTYGQTLVESPRLYQTDVLKRKGVAFIRRRARGEEPFFLSMAFLAPHHESTYAQRLTGHAVRSAPRHRGTFAGQPFHRPRSYNERDVSDKPWFVARWHGPITPRRDAAIVHRMRERWTSLLAVDEAVADIVGALRRTGELGNTYIIFTSDNGYLQGEHRIPSGKMLPYDPSTQVPLLVRGPGIPRGGVSRALVGNVDLAPTILDAASASAPFPLDGRSFRRYARNTRLRSSRPLLHETAGIGVFGRRIKEEGEKEAQPRVPAWRAVRTTRWLFVDYRGGQAELYDLERDPAQLQSLARDPRYRVQRRTLQRMLGDLSRCAGVDCRRLGRVAVR